MTAVGGYIRALREGQHITRSGLAGDLDVDATTLWRIEEGKQEPSGTLLFSLVAAIRGDYEDVRRLLIDKDATEASGRRLAQTRLSAASETAITQFVNTLDEDEIAQVRRQIADDPEFLDAIARAIVRKRH